MWSCVFLVTTECTIGVFLTCCPQIEVFEKGGVWCFDDNAKCVAQCFYLLIKKNKHLQSQYQTPSGVLKNSLIRCLGRNPVIHFECYVFARYCCHYLPHCAQHFNAFACLLIDRGRQEGEQKGHVIHVRLLFGYYNNRTLHC